MSNYIMWSMIVGFLLPPIEAVIQQTHWSNPIRAVVNFILCCIVALGVVYFEGNTDFHHWVKAALATLVTAISVYKGLWRPTTVATRIEKATTVKSI